VEEEEPDVDNPQRAVLYSTVLRSPAGACSTASTAATMSPHRGGEEEAAVATIVATARGRVCVFPKASTVTSPAEETHDRLCLVAAVEDGNVVDADLVRGGRKAVAVVAGEGRERMANRLEARDRRRRPRNSMLRWRITSAAAVVTAVLLQMLATATHSSKTAVDPLLRHLLRLETTTST
jgi:hypothetical protein